MSILGADGKAVEKTLEDKLGKTPEPKKTEEQAMPEGPALAIDKLGNMTVFIPLSKTSDIYADGFLSFARKHMEKWYRDRAQAQQEASILAAKTGFGRLKDKAKELFKR